MDLPFVSEFVDTELSVVASTFIDVGMKGRGKLGLKKFLKGRLVLQSDGRGVISFIIVWLHLRSGS